MKTMNLKSIQECLSRSEMKSIRGGDLEDFGKCKKVGSGCDSGGQCCSGSCGGGENPVCCPKKKVSGISESIIDFGIE